MASTPRAHRYLLPMLTRSTDIQQLNQCPGRWVLSKFYEKEQKPASFFELGSALHECIEQTILEDWDEHQAAIYLDERIGWWTYKMEGVDVLESSKRGVDTMYDDAIRMLSNWFHFVHPDSEDRLDIYKGYDWPPRVELPFFREVETGYPVWGSVDAVFTGKAATNFLIVDWKSSASRQKDSDQLHFYRYGLEMQKHPAHYHNLDRVRAAYVIQEADPYPGDDVVRQRILDAEAIKDSILTDQQVHFQPDWYCQWCPVQHLCPAEGPDPAKHKRDLRRMLKLARPMTEIDTTEVA